MPRRIQRKRTGGWRMPEGAIYVGRPTRWGNPFIVGALLVDEHGADAGSVRDRKHARDLFGSWLIGPGVGGIRTSFGPTDDCQLIPADLAGHDLACWCPLDQPCHADVLLEYANP